MTNLPASRYSDDVLATALLLFLVEEFPKTMTTNELERAVIGPTMNTSEQDQCAVVLDGLARDGLILVERGRIHPTRAAVRFYELALR